MMIDQMIAGVLFDISIFILSLCFLFWVSSLERRIIKLERTKALSCLSPFTHDLPDLNPESECRDCHKTVKQLFTHLEKNVDKNNTIT